jgi:hypothetical protein
MVDPPLLDLLLPPRNQLLRRSQYNLTSPVRMSLILGKTTLRDVEIDYNI